LCDFVTDKLRSIAYNGDIKQKEIKMNPFVKFMASTTGRITRIAAGVVLIAWGLLGLTGTTGIVVAIVGLVPLVAGLFDFCVLAPLFGAPLSGPRIRIGK
jgi:heme O synthase-like polyprenyltransferase